MKLTAGELHDAQRALTGIIQKPRQIPQMAKYRIAKLHTALEKEFARIEDARVQLVQEYGEEMFADEAKTQSLGWQVPQGSPKMEAYTKAWDALRAQEVEVNAQPLPLHVLGLTEDLNGIQAMEFKMLACLIVEPEPVTA